MNFDSFEERQRKIHESMKCEVEMDRLIQKDTWRQINRFTQFRESEVL
jgi:hypothetical protein